MSTQRDMLAFPWSDPEQNSGATGMKLRDYFAAKALAGMLANPQGDYSPLTKSAVLGYAADAYACADAMLNAREADE